MKTSAKSLTVSKTGKFALLVIAICLLSVKGFSQDPGGNPDGPPPAVPFDDYLNWILFAVGAIFALFAIKKMQKKHSSN